MTPAVHHLDRYAGVLAALADPYLVPPPADAGPVGGVAWLRASVARFSSGETHARRRALADGNLARVDPDALAEAAALEPGDDPRQLSVRVLAAALGIAEPEAAAAAVTDLTRAYFDGGPDATADRAVADLLKLVTTADATTDPAVADLLRLMATADATADRAIADLLKLMPTADDDVSEVAANRIGLLVQAGDATGGLIDRARRAPGDDIETLLVETLRHDPPVRTMRRVAVRDTVVEATAVAAGDLVVLNVAAANRDPRVFTDADAFDPQRSGPPPLTFGGPPRVCPGRKHALAIAAGVLSRDRLPRAGRLS